MNFLERLHNEVLVGDGAIGTMLYAKGVGLDVNFEHLNLVRPELVLELHGEYIAAGAQVVETNTFGANYTRLQAIGLGRKVGEINIQGARLARQAAAGHDVYVAGSVGPLVRIKGEEQELSPAETLDMFREQCLALAEGGVDLFLLETFSDPGQMKAALAAARETGLPVIASMAYLEGGRSAGGAELEVVTAALAAAGADAIGVNCGAGPLEVLRNVRRMALVTELPLAAYANSGFPEYVDGRYIYRATPDYFADMALEMARAGAGLVGGCCGTTPDHIRTIAEKLKSIRPFPRTVTVRVEPGVERQDLEPGKRTFLAAGARTR